MNLITIPMLLCISFTFSSMSFAAQKPEARKVKSATLNVDGEFENQDEELNFLQNELRNVRGLKTGYKRKSKVFQKLTNESEELKSHFESYIESRVDYEKAIGDYNKTIECLKSGDAVQCRPDLANKKKEQARPAARQVRRERPITRQEVQDYVGSSMSANLRKSSGDEIQNFIRDVDLKVAQRDSELLSCYRAGGYSQEGVLKVQLKISPNGNLGHLGFEDTTQVNDPRVIRCLSKVLYSINYPSTPDGRTKTIRKPFIFNLM